MRRRQFLTRSIAAATASTLAGGSEASTGAVPSAHPQRQFYQLRHYRLQNGPQTKLADDYFSGALLPALNRLGIAPVGVFHLDIGPETPTTTLLLPSPSAELLATLDLRLADDATFIAAAEPFWNAPAEHPPCVRVESSLLLAFEGWPMLTLPAGTAQHAKRIFQLRIYESPTPAAHVRKVEMFHRGEFAIFERTGLHPVFFSQTLIGARLPSLTYMLTFADMAELTANWQAFSADPEWKKLSTAPRYAEPIVSNITNLILSPAAYSQI